MSILICGVLSYDTVMVFNDKFKYHISQDHVQGQEEIDIYFMVPDLRRQFGGCAGNIAYNLNLLGADPLIMATVGADFNHYAEWLDKQNIKRDYIAVVEHSYTAQTFVTIDMDDNHITAFHPGAMNFSSTNQVWQAKEATIGIVCSESADAMMIHALQFVEAGIPFIFDPGQSVQLFDGDELLKFLEQAQWILLNRKEWQIVHQRTGLSAEQVAMRVQALIITQEAQGAMIYTQETRYNIPAAKAKAVNDPTGCSDAFCAGILYGLAKEIDWETTGRIAALMGAIKVEHHGTQNHTVTLDLFKARFKKNFGYALII